MTAHAAPNRTTTKETRHEGTCDRRRGCVHRDRLWRLRIRHDDHRPDAEQAQPADAVEVTIAEAEIGTGEVTIRGEKPTPCHELGSIVDPTGDAIEIEVWAEPAGGENCAQVIDSFEISFELDSPAVETPIIVNGEAIGRIGG